MFKIGDVVRLKGGSAPLTVIKADFQDKITVVWEHEAKHVTMCYPADALTPIEDQPDPPTDA